MNGIRYGVGLLFAATLVLLTLIPASGKEATVYTLGVIPAFPPVTTHREWTPFVKRLSEESGIEFRLKVYAEMSNFEQEIISTEAPDFIFVNALQLVVARNAQGFVPLVRGAGQVRAVLFVSKDSPIERAEELSGKKVAFVGGKNL